jgi:hypothetical protein
MLTDRLYILKIMKPFDETTEEALIARTPYLPKLQRFDRCEVSLDGGLINGNVRRRPLAVGKRVGVASPYGGQLDEALAVEREHVPSTYHVTEDAVGLPPVPCLAEEFRQNPPAGRGVSAYEIVDECNVFACDGFAAKPQEFFHGGRTIA